MEDLRFLVPPTLFFLIVFLVSYFYGKPFNLSDQKLLALMGFISLPAIGFLISQVSIFVININDFMALGGEEIFEF